MNELHTSLSSFLLLNSIHNLFHSCLLCRGQTAMSAMANYLWRSEILGPSVGSFAVTAL